MKEKLWESDLLTRYHKTTNEKIKDLTMIKKILNNFKYFKRIAFPT